MEAKISWQVRLEFEKNLINLMLIADLELSGKRYTIIL